MDERSFSKNELSTDVMERVNRELGVINKLGFCDYFLIVWDFVRFRGRGRASRARLVVLVSARWFATH